MSNALKHVHKGSSCSCGQDHQHSTCCQEGNHTHKECTCGHDHSHKEHGTAAKACCGHSSHEDGSDDGGEGSSEDDQSQFITDRSHSEGRLDKTTRHVDCEHDHEHDHSDSCCGHDHEHDHGDGCGDGCGCGHDHEHDHGDGCGCGHDHDHAASAPYSTPVGIAGIVLILAAFLLPLGSIGIPLMSLGIFMVGYPLFIDGFRSILRFSFDELALMTIAVVSALLIGEAPEAAMVTILFRIGNWLEAKAIAKSKRDIAALTQIRPDTANLVKADGEVVSVAAKTLAIGSRIVIKPGERVPVDCVVESGSTYLDTSALTGEPLPVQATKGSTVLSGSINTDGAITCITTNSFEDSAASRIIKMVSEAALQKGDTERLISKFSKVYTPIVMACAAALAFLPPLLGFGEFSMWIGRALVFLVASCPCALVISVPLTFFAGVGRATKQGVLIKGTKYIETLAKADCVVFDKTGTLTLGVPVVDQIIPAEGVDPEHLIRLAATAEQFSNHPAAKAILQRAGDFTPALSSDYTETPGMGISLTVEGVRVHCGSALLMQNHGIDLSHLPTANIYVAVGDKAIGCITLADQLRSDAKEAIAALTKLGVKTVAMLTGDSSAAAQKIAKELGVGTVYSQLLPQDKVEKMAQLKKSHSASIFVGDGINDAPVLAMSDAGIAMGLGTDTAIEAADVVLMSESLRSIPSSIKLSRKIVSKAKFNIAFALTIKIGVLILGAAGIANMWMAVFADVGVSILAVLNAVSGLNSKND